MKNGKLKVAVVGLNFGSAFLPIHINHPDTYEVGIFDPSPEVTRLMSERYKSVQVYSSYEEVLQDKEVDAIHLISPIPLHEEQTVAALLAGKHCACTVPMALSLTGIRRIIDAVKKSGKNFMMMETSVYTTHFLHVKEMIKNGEFGRIQFMRGAHYQDMENWPDYWLGLPPMYYGTHAIAPLVLASGSRITRTHCFGSGTMRQELVERYGNPFPVESALYEFENGLKGEVTRTLFETARDYTESFYIYGSHRTFEWQQVEYEQNPIIFTMGEPRFDEDGTPLRGNAIDINYFEPANRPESLPESIQRFTIRSTQYDETNPQITFEEGGGHGGAHPHLVHEFLRSIIEERKAAIDEYVAANITAAGICAHLSAMQGGREVIIPDFEKE